MNIHLYSLKGALRVTDEDSADFLQSQFSNDLRPFDVGQATYGLWLDVKGKVIADSFVVCCAEEEFLVLSEHSPSETIQQKLEQHIIADDVEVESLDGVSGLSIIGGGAEAHLGSSEALAAFAGRRSVEPSVELIFESESSRDDYVSELGLSSLSSELLHSKRIRAGYPQIPVEIGAFDLPGEGGLENSAISFTKGCFLGQEVVARMHNLGKATRMLYHVEGKGMLPNCPTALLTNEGKTAGELRSGYASDKGWFGVALIKIRYVDEMLKLADKGQAIERRVALGKPK